MQVSVRYFTVLREVTNKKEEILEFPEEQKTTVAAILKILSNRYGRTFAEYIYDTKSGSVKSFLQFFINGQSTNSSKGTNSEMQNGDVLAIVPPVGGG